VLATFVLLAGLSAATLFSTDDPLPLELSAPFNDLFDHARNDTNGEYAVAGSLTFSDQGRAVTIAGVKIMLRGNTSRRESECAFPKLKVEFPAGARPASPLFLGLASIKIGTHCGEATQGQLTPRFGRLANEQSVQREVFVYRLLAATAVPTLKARLAHITYRYTDPREGQSPAQEQPVVRSALVLEGNDEAVRRVGGVGDINEDKFTSAQAQFDPVDTVRLTFAEAMIGNFDWCLKMTPDDRYRCDARHPLWNITAAKRPDGRATPLIYDFDVSGIVTGRHAWFGDVFAAAFLPNASQAEIEVVAQLQRARTLFARGELEAARAAFIAHKRPAYRALETAALDAEGREIARAYLDSFYQEIESDDRFYRPVVVARTEAYATADGQALCSPSAVAPPGTPVSAPMQTAGARVQVMLLDALWQWASSTKCEAVRSGPVWIDARAIGRDFPAR
jgi:hypothetical protein